MLYPKINSLWKRQGWFLEEGKKNNPDYQAGRQSFIIGDYASPEFGNIKRWRVQEKIDGTNIRISYDQNNKTTACMGRTAEALIPPHLLRHLVETITPHKLDAVFLENEKIDSQPIWLFGEGYGPKIQKGGGNYRKDVGFILFDVKIGSWWLEQPSVKEIAARLDIPYAPEIGIMTEDEIVAYVKSKPMSLCSLTPQVMEGIIARPENLLLKRDGDPLIMKLKCKEF